MVDSQEAHALAEDCKCVFWVPVGKDVDGKDIFLKAPITHDAGDVCVRREVVEEERQHRKENPDASPGR